MCVFVCRGGGGLYSWDRLSYVQVHMTKYFVTLRRGRKELLISNTICCVQDQVSLPYTAQSRDTSPWPWPTILGHVYLYITKPIPTIQTPPTTHEPTHMKRGFGLLIWVRLVH